MAVTYDYVGDPREREARLTIPVYGQLPFVPARADGCDIVTTDGRRILDLYGGHAVAALGYGHPELVNAIREQSESLLFQSNAVALDVGVFGRPVVPGENRPNLLVLQQRVNLAPPGRVVDVLVAEDQRLLGVQVGDPVDHLEAAALLELAQDGLLVHENLVEVDGGEVDEAFGGHGGMGDDDVVGRGRGRPGTRVPGHRRGTLAGGPGVR